jgi:hypothetical protein
MNKCEQNHRKMNRVTWPSGLRRCVQVAVFERGRGFKSHSYQIFLAFFTQGFFSLFFCSEVAILWIILIFGCFKIILVI